MISPLLFSVLQQSWSHTLITSFFLKGQNKYPMLKLYMKLQITDGGKASYDTVLQIWEATVEYKPWEAYFTG